MEILFQTLQKVCVLVTLTFALTRTPFFSRLFRTSQNFQDRFTAGAIFLLMALTEELVAQQYNPMNARVIAACAAGLTAGPLVGGIVGIGGAFFALLLQGKPPAAFGIAILAGGVVCGILRRRHPTAALTPLVGFIAGSAFSLARFATASAFHQFAGAARPPLPVEMEALTAVANGAGVALILLVLAQVRQQEEQARATAMAEVRALQARMNPHFLFNALNTVAAVSTVNPQAVPAAIFHLGRFLRAGIDQHDRTHIPLSEELAVVAAYLEVETLRLGPRLRVEYDIAPEILEVDIPPFLLQPLVENAVIHGIQPQEDGGRYIRIAGRAENAQVILTVTDNGVGMEPRPLPSEGPNQGASGTHALSLLHRRLQGLYGNAATLDFHSVPGEGSVVTVRFPAETAGVSQRSGSLKHSLISKGQAS